MAYTTWIVVFFNLLSGAAMGPTTSPSSPPLSMYDICAQADLHQIEELKESLFEEFSRSSINLDENVSVSFGLLDEDWTRLQDLERRIPEESVLKSKVLIVFRILIAALYQAHGSTFEQDDDFLVNEGQNGIYYEDGDSTSEFGFEESNHHDVVVYDFKSNTWTTNFDEDFEGYPQSTYLNLKDYPGPSKIQPTTSRQVEYQNNHYPSNYQEQTTSNVNDDFEKRKSKEEIQESNYDLNLNFTSIESKSTSNPTLEHILYQNLDATTDEFSTTIRKEENKIKHDTKLDDTTNYLIKTRYYDEGEVNAETTERTIFPPMHSETSTEYSSTACETTSTVSPTSRSASQCDSGTTTSDLSLIGKQEITNTIVSLKDLTASSVYPELVELILNDRINNKVPGKPVSFNALEETLNVFATTTESWGKNQILEDMEGSDSVISEVIVLKNKTENELKAISDSYMSKENSESVSNRTYNLTDITNLSNIPDSSKQQDGFNELPTANQNYFSNQHQTTKSLGNDLFINNYVTKSTKQIIPEITEHMVSVENDNNDRSSERSILSQTAPTKHTISESSEHMSSAENDNVQSSSEERGVFSPIDNSGLSLNKYTIPRNSEHMSSAENDNEQSSSVERSIVSTTNRNGPIPNKYTITRSSEHTRKENYNVQNTSVEIDVLSPTNNNASNLNTNTIPESLENISSTENDNGDSRRISLSPIYSYGRNSTKHSIFESSEHISSKEKVHVQISSVERGVVSPTNNYGPTPNEGTVPDSSEHILSAENDNIQISNIEKSPVVPTTNNSLSPNKDNITDSFEHMSNAENDDSQWGSVERDVLSSTSDNGVNFIKVTVPEISDYVFSREKYDLQSGVKENHVSRPTSDGNEYVAVHFIPKISEHILKEENEDTENDSAETNVYIKKNNDGEIRAVENSQESSASAENESLQRRLDEKPLFSSKNSDEADLASHQVPESSERITSAENINLHSSVEREDISSLRNDYNFGPTAKVTAESSDHMSSAENVNLQSSFEGEDVSSSKNNDVVLTSNEDIPEHSENTFFSTESDHFQRSSIETVVISPANNNGGSPSTQAIRDDTQFISSAENTNTPTKSKSLGGVSKEDRSNWTPYPGLSHLVKSNVQSTDDSEESENNEKLEFNQGTTNLPAKVDDAPTATEQTKESYRTFHVLFSKSLDIPLPTLQYNHFKTYPSYWPSNVITRKRCHDGNECVHVQHIEYKSYDNPLSSELPEYDGSRHTSRSSEMMEDSPASVLSQTEERIWQDKLRSLKGSNEK